MFKFIFLLCIVYVSAHKRFSICDDKDFNLFFMLDVSNSNMKSVQSQLDKTLQIIDSTDKSGFDYSLGAYSRISDVVVNLESIQKFDRTDFTFENLLDNKKLTKRGNRYTHIGDAFTNLVTNQLKKGSTTKNVVVLFTDGNAEHYSYRRIQNRKKEISKSLMYVLDDVKTLKSSFKDTHVHCVMTKKDKYAAFFIKKKIICDTFEYKTPIEFKKCTGEFTQSPTRYPTKMNKWPTRYPTKMNKWPTRYPTKMNKWPTRDPTNFPSKRPTKEPTEFPTKNPTDNPTGFPTKTPTYFPTRRPSKEPTEFPTKNPTDNPTGFPTKTPTYFPTRRPSKEPTEFPTKNPTDNPTGFPTKTPTYFPTRRPSKEPTEFPTKTPTRRPTTPPITSFTPAPSVNPSSFCLYKYIADPEVSTEHYYVNSRHIITAGPDIDYVLKDENIRLNDNGQGVFFDGTLKEAFGSGKEISFIFSFNESVDYNTCNNAERCPKCELGLCYGQEQQWDYYSNVVGRIWGSGLVDLTDGELGIDDVCEVSIGNMPYPQVGLGANGKNHLYGISSWFFCANTESKVQLDINADILLCI